MRNMQLASWSILLLTFGAYFSDGTKVGGLQRICSIVIGLFLLRQDVGLEGVQWVYALKYINAHTYVSVICHVDF